MGNENSIQSKISNKLHGKRPSEVEINIGAPTSVVHLDKSAVLKLLEQQQQQANMKGGNVQKRPSDPRTKMHINQDVCDRRIDNVCQNARKCSKGEATFQSYVKIEQTETNNERPSVPRKLSLKSQEEIEEMAIGTPTNVVHIGGLDVVKLVEKQAQSCTENHFNDTHFNKRIEEAKEVPKMLFKPDAFNETSEDTFKKTMKPVPLPIQLDVQNVPTTAPLPPPRSPRSLQFIARSEPHLNKNSKPSELVDEIQRGLESVKKQKRSGRKSEIQDLVNKMHEALDVIMTTYLDSSDGEGEN